MSILAILITKADPLAQVLFQNCRFLNFNFQNNLDNLQQTSRISFLFDKRSQYLNELTSINTLFVL